MESEGSQLRTDQLATEEPLEIRLRAAGIADRAGPLPVFRRRSERAGQRTVAITMRTPGADFELAAGVLYGEGIIRSGDEIRGISHCEEPGLDEDKRYNIVNVDLHGDALPDLQALERHFYTTSACGSSSKLLEDDAMISVTLATDMDPPPGNDPRPT